MKIQLGTIVTNMAGSTGGQTVRRFRGGHVLQNKVLKKSRFQYNNGVRIAYNSKLFNRWNGLNESDRLAWNNAGKDYTFYDKFGNPKNLSGRELYLKLNAQSILVGNADVDVSRLNSNLTDFFLELLDMNFAGSFVSISMGSISAGINYAVGLMPLKNGVVNPNPARAKVVSFASSLDYDDYNIYPWLLNNYPWLDDGSWILVVCWQINESGFKSAPQFLKLQLS